MKYGQFHGIFLHICFTYKIHCMKKMINHSQSTAERCRKQAIKLVRRKLLKKTAQNKISVDKSSGSVHQHISVKFKGKFQLNVRACERYAHRISSGSAFNHLSSFIWRDSVLSNSFFSFSVFFHTMTFCFKDYFFSIFFFHHTVKRMISTFPALLLNNYFIISFTLLHLFLWRLLLYVYSLSL